MLSKPYSAVFITIVFVKPAYLIYIRFKRRNSAVESQDIMFKGFFTKILHHFAYVKVSKTPEIGDEFYP